MWWRTATLRSGEAGGGRVPLLHRRAWTVLTIIMLHLKWNNILCCMCNRIQVKWFFGCMTWVNISMFCIVNCKSWEKSNDSQISCILGTFIMASGKIFAFIHTWPDTVQTFRGGGDKRNTTNTSARNAWEQLWHMKTDMQFNNQLKINNLTSFPGNKIWNM